MKIRVSRVLHAGYIFETLLGNILFDPIFENPFSHNCYAFPAVRFDTDKIQRLKFSAVFISHYHDDHCSLESLQFIERGTKIYIYCDHPDLINLIREFGFTDVEALKMDQVVKVAGLEIKVWRALEFDVDCIFQISTPSINILNVVDAWIVPETLFYLSKIKWDLVLWPFQTLLESDVTSPRRAAKAQTHVDPEFLTQLKKLDPRFTVPSSCQFRHEAWSWYNFALFPITYQQFAIDVETFLPRSRVIRMDPGVTHELTENEFLRVGRLDWVELLENPEVDYKYEGMTRATPTSEISSHFRALKPNESEKILSFCRADLVEKLRTLPVGGLTYFSKPRNWQLDLYAQNGDVTSFYYAIDGRIVTLLETIPQDLHWTTEIATAKLYAALYDGEALTSLYLRVNDRTFGAPTELEIRDADVYEDPLIRVISRDSAGAYQKAQFKKLASGQASPRVFAT